MIFSSWLVSLLFIWSSLSTLWATPATTSKLFQGFKKNLPIHSSSSSSSVCHDGEWGIRSLIVPELVENGTTESIVLDCIYCLNEGEDHRIVVKWFLNDDPQPIYQWIPERHSRHASKRLSGRINLNYSIDSANPLTQYRAINIIKPTTDLSGDYSCVVMSPDNGDSKKAKMIVYAPPTKIEFNYTREVKEMPSALRKTRGDSKEDSPLNPSFEELLSSPSHSLHTQSSTGLLRCDIKGVYPMPEVSIYRIGDENGTNPWPVTVVDTRIEEDKHRHAYNVRKVSLINDATLIKKFGLQPSIFECLVTLQLPNKKVVKRQKIMYTPVVNTFQVKGGQHRLGTTFLITLLTVFSGKLVLTLLGWQ